MSYLNPLNWIRPAPYTGPPEVQREDSEEHLFLDAQSHSSITDEQEISDVAQRVLPAPDTDDEFIHLDREGNEAPIPPPTPPPAEPLPIRAQVIEEPPPPQGLFQRLKNRIGLGTAPVPLATAPILDPTAPIRANLGDALSEQVDALTERMLINPAFASYSPAKIKMTLLVFMNAFKNHLESNAGIVTNDSSFADFVANMRAGEAVGLLDAKCDELTRKLMISLTLEPSPKGFDKALLQSILPNLLKEIILPNLTNPTRLLTYILEHANQGNTTSTFSRIGKEFSTRILTPEFQREHSTTTKALSDAFGNGFNASIRSMDTNSLLLAAISPIRDDAAAAEELAVALKDLLFPTSLGPISARRRYRILSGKGVTPLLTDAKKMALARTLAAQLKTKIQESSVNVAYALLGVLERTC